MIAIDSSVLIDLLGDPARDNARADAAEACVRQALANGPVAVCDVVLSEVTACLGRGTEVADVIEEMGMRYSPIEQRSALRAGEMQRKYNARGAPGKTRSGPDFLVGAHAMLQCTGLITHDSAFFRDYFKGLKLIVPKTSV